MHVCKKGEVMNSTYYIEKSILASILNSELTYELSANKFTNMFHRKLVNGINRLKELGEYIDFETLRNKFLKDNEWTFEEDNKWTFEEDNMLTDLMSNTTPFSTQKIFDEYMRIIDNEYLESFDRRLAI